MLFEEPPVDSDNLPLWTALLNHPVTWLLLLFLSKTLLYFGYIQAPFHRILRTALLTSLVTLSVGFSIHWVLGLLLGEGSWEENPLLSSFLMPVYEGWKGDGDHVLNTPAHFDILVKTLLTSVPALAVAVWIEFAVLSKVFEGALMSPYQLRTYYRSRPLPVFPLKTIHFLMLALFANLLCALLMGLQGFSQQLDLMFSESPLGEMESTLDTAQK